MLSVVMVSYPRRQQLRRLKRAARHAGGGIIASVGAVLLLVARLLRCRGLAPAAAALMVVAMVRLLAQLWLPGSHVVAPTLQGGVMHVGVYVTALAGVTEYLLLLFLLPRE